MTNEKTIDQTMGDTPQETIARTYVECVFTYHWVNLKEIIAIFSFSIIFLVIIQMIS